MRLLEDDEAPVFTVLNPAAESPFLLTADHAGRAVPRALGDMGVSAAALSEADKRLRRQAIFEPYHAQIDQLIGARRTRPPIYVAMHSFTPVYLGAARGMHVAVLYHCRPRFSHLLAALLREEGGLVVAENDPYRVSDETDYGVPVHAEARGLDYVEIEIRQDLIADAPGQAEWAARLARLLPAAAARLMAEQAKEGKA